MKRVMRILLPLSVAALAFPAWPQSSLPAGTRWLDHLNKELLPFWTTDSAFGNPFGAFPETRCDDATLYDQRDPCPEIQRNTWISPQQRYVVALSRQAYGYGVAFHLTGKRAYLDAMKAGIDFIRQNAMDRVNGGMATKHVRRLVGSRAKVPHFARAGVWLTRHGFLLLPDSRRGRRARYSRC